MKNILTIGAGFIASHLPFPIIKDRLEANEKQIRTILNLYKPDIVINCIGYCGQPNIDACETNKERTIQSNLVIPSILASECNKLNIKLLHIGSGCIYYGESPNLSISLDGPKDMGWREENNPKLEKASLYSKIKYACDLAIGSLPNTCILRIRMPVSSINSPRNLINKLLNYKFVLEHPNSMTFLPDLIRAIDWMIEKEKSGIYHIANPQPLTHIDILSEFQKYYPEHTYTKINNQELEQFITAPRSNCILDTKKLNSEGFEMTNSFVALEQCMKEFVANKRKS